MAGDFPVGPVVLGYLLLHGQSHGYELLSRLRAELGRVWRVSPSQLYSTLELLERRGLIVGTKEVQENRPPRVRYSLTEEGEKAFWHWAMSPVPRVRLLRTHFLPKIFSLLNLAPERIPELLSAQKEVLLSLRSRVEEEKPTDRFQKILRDFRLHQLEASLRWLTELEKEVSV